MTHPTVVVLRPEPGNAATCRAAFAADLAPISSPLFVIEPAAWDPPNPSRFDAVLLGSANAIRHAGSALAGFTGLPAYAVGEATAMAARETGFHVVATGERGIEALLAVLRDEPVRRALRLAGEAHVELAPAPDCEIETAIVYRARPLSLDGEAETALRRGAPALVHSAEAARHFADECDRLGIQRERIVLACLGPRVAEAAGPGWREARSAAKPTDAALLALAREMCQTRRDGVAHHP